MPLDFEAAKRLTLSQTCHTVTAAKATSGVKAAGVNSAVSLIPVALTYLSLQERQVVLLMT